MPPIAHLCAILAGMGVLALTPAVDAASDGESHRRASETGYDLSVQESPRSQPVPLSPRRQIEAPRNRSTSGTGPAPLDQLAGDMPEMVKVAGSLAVVLAIFCVVAWFMKRSLPKAAAMLPGEVVQVLGRAPLVARQEVCLVRCGRKLLLVNVTASGAETLTEITDPVEVDRIAGICQQSDPTSATAAFRQIFQQFGSRRGVEEANA